MNVADAPAVFFQQVACLFGFQGMAEIKRYPHVAVVYDAEGFFKLLNVLGQNPSKCKKGSPAPVEHALSLRNR